MEMLNAAAVITQATNTIITLWMCNLACLSQLNSCLQQIHWGLQSCAFFKNNGKT